MMLISDYINEKEKFFCFAYLKICDIIIGESYKYEICALQLLQVILNGSLWYFQYNQHLWHHQIQMRLVKYHMAILRDEAKSHPPKIQEWNNYADEI